MPDEGPVPLVQGDIHHLRDVLRLGPGDVIVVAFAGTAHQVRLSEVEPHVSGVMLAEVPAAMLPRVTLAQGIAKGEKMDDIVRQTTEIGVARIVPFAAERSVVRLDASKAAARTVRWRKIAAEAAKQSQRTDVPAVLDVVTSASLGAALAGSVVLVCWEDADGAPGIAAALEAIALLPQTDVAVVVGPEGGLTAQEVRRLVSAGATAVSLGGTILRTETAGVVACALAVHARGGLGAQHD